MGDGTKENPFTREDVLRLIEENGGTAEGLYLSGKIFEEGIDLRGLNNNCLQGIILNKARFPLNLRRDKRDAPLRGANLKGVHLEGANLRSAHLEEADLSDTYLESANLGGIHLEGANLSGAHLGSAYLGSAHLQGAILQSAEFSADTGLENVDWGNYILGDESMGFDIAADTYRRLKQWYTNAGMYGIAGEFFFREMTAKRKGLKWWPKPWNRALSKLISILCGYGERPLRVIAWAASVVFGLALLYFFLRGVAPYTLTVQAFLGSLYYSAVSFTALGYGPWFSASSVRSWVQGVGAAEAIIGVFMIALFLVTFTRKMTR